ncbi:Asp/Glu/hydantoin racemase [Rhizobium petrolearium]|uniref:aspartate/glutamate racemase family protein n=1 Tax=Neorhizobium petrolearium TaxID=515361 RepID=UPI001AE674A7|nr:aspartate/glutamate racemase family protein [Neorhizobium petrolearium]MBP1845510.1 Asp/Glu/hydantoin racemase [Neorhizobium petrolearium]
MPVLLFNPNTNAETTASMVDIASTIGLAVEGRTAAFGASMIVEPKALAVGAKAVLTLLDEALAGPEPVDGIIVAAFGDPGLAEMRIHPEVVRCGIAVCGIGEASFLEAAAGGRRFAVATTTPALETSIAEAVATTGLSDLFLGSFFTPSDPFSAVADPALLVDLLSDTVVKAVRAGAEAVIIGGGPLARAAAALSSRHALAIIEPVPAAARLISARIAAKG